MWLRRPEEERWPQNTDIKVVNDGDETETSRTNMCFTKGARKAEVTLRLGSLVDQGALRRCWQQIPASSLQAGLLCNRLLEGILPGARRIISLTVAKFQECRSEEQWHDPKVATFSFGT